MWLCKILTASCGSLCIAIIPVSSANVHVVVFGVAGMSAVDKVQSTGLSMLSCSIPAFITCISEYESFTFT